MNLICFSQLLDRVINLVMLEEDCFFVESVFVPLLPDVRCYIIACSPHLPNMDWWVAGAVRCLHLHTHKSTIHHPSKTFSHRRSEQKTQTTKKGFGASIRLGRSCVFIPSNALDAVKALSVLRWARRVLVFGPKTLISTCNRFFIQNRNIMEKLSNSIQKKSNWTKYALFI